MNFNEFLEYISYYDYPKEETYKLSYMWLHPEYIPKSLDTLGIYDEVYKIKPFTTNYYSLISKEKLNKPINVPITKFNKNLFKNNSKIKCIVLNNYINQLDEEAFLNCSNLRYLYLNKNITFIPKDCFKGCNDLEIYYEGNEEDFNIIRVIYKEHKAIFKPGLYDDVVEYIVPGNEAFINAKIHYNSKIEFNTDNVSCAIEPRLL